MASFAVTLLATTLLAAAPPVLAQQPKLPPPDGRYTGSITLRDESILQVALGLGTKHDGKPGSDLRFDEPWVCALELRPPSITAVTTDGKTETIAQYAFTGHADARCATLMPGYMRVRPATDGSTGAYRVELFKSGGSTATLLYSVTLRAPAAKGQSAPPAPTPAPAPTTASPSASPAAGGTEAKPN